MPRVPRPSPKRTRAVALVVASLFVVPVHAQNAPAGDSAPAAETVEPQLVRLNRTLERIAELLERQVEGQRIDLVLKRLELGSRRVETLEPALHAAQEKRRSLEDQRYQIQSRLKMFEDELDRMDTEELEDDQQGFTIMVGQAERELQVVEARLEETTGRIVELENELTRCRDDLRSLQDGVDRALGGM